MKKLLLPVLAGLLCLTASAQTLRTNYRSEGLTHISTDYESVKIGDIPALVRVELAGFPDGSTLYLIYMNLEQKESTVVPKGVKMAVTLTGGKVVRLSQIGQDSATKRRLDNGMFINRLKYAAETADMEKMVRGIKSLDIITGWDPDDYIQATFADDALGALLKRHCEAILGAAASTIDLTASLASYTENANSVLANANPLVARGKNYDYNVLLSHLYYKNTNEEDVDLAFVIGSKEQFHVPYDAKVRFTLRDGSEIELLQTRDDNNFVYVYPEPGQLALMASVGVDTLRIEYEGGTLEDSFPVGEEKNGFSDAINQQLQLLLSLSPR